MFGSWKLDLHGQISQRDHLTGPQCIQRGLRQHSDDGKDSVHGAHNGGGVAQLAGQSGHEGDDGSGA